MTNPTTVGDEPVRGRSGTQDSGGQKCVEEGVIRVRMRCSTHYASPSQRVWQNVNRTLFFSVGVVPNFSKDNVELFLNFLLQNLPQEKLDEDDGIFLVVGEATERDHGDLVQVHVCARSFREVSPQPIRVKINTS